VHYRSGSTVRGTQATNNRQLLRPAPQPSPACCHCHETFMSTFVYRKIGRRTAEGRSGSWKTCCSAARKVVPVPSGSPEPRLRAKRGWAPLETWIRNRWPRLKQYPVGHMSMRVRRTLAALGSGRKRISPSLTLSDRPRPSTSAYYEVARIKLQIRPGQPTWQARSSGAASWRHGRDPCLWRTSSGLGVCRMPAPNPLRNRGPNRGRIARRAPPRSESA
jgi:hypothetical protein